MNEKMEKQIDRMQYEFLRECLQMFSDIERAKIGRERVIDISTPFYLRYRRLVTKYNNAQAAHSDGRYKRALRTSRLLALNLAHLYLQICARQIQNSTRRYVDDTTIIANIWNSYQNLELSHLELFDV